MSELKEKVKSQILFKMYDLIKNKKCGVDLLHYYYYTSYLKMSPGIWETLFLDIF